MKHDTNAFDQYRKEYGKVLPRMCFAALILVAVLLYAAFGKDGSRLLISLDCLASVVLKAALTCFLMEAAGVLHGYRRQQPYRSAENQKDERDPVVSDAAVVSDAEDSSEEQKTPSSACPVPEFLDAQIDEQSPFDDFSHMENSAAEEPAYGQDGEHAAAPQQLRFGFQGTDPSTREALDIIDGTRQGSIILVTADKGELIGEETQDGQYLVYPGEECLTEAELRYSPITACFEMAGSTRRGQQVQVRCDKPAVLAKAEDGLYEIAEKGVLTVISTMD